MCGRFTLRTPVEEIAEIFGVEDVGGLDLPPRYNIAPTQPVAVVRRSGEDGRRKLALLRWGLLPGWVKDPADWPTLINARAETLHRRPAFEDALRFRRCLVPADGFFEWKREGGGKQPYYVRAADGAPLAFAGLWERWTGEDGEPVESCTIVTTGANELVRPLHDRMPLILGPDARERWLDPELRRRRELEPLLRSSPAEGLVAYPVSREVNRPEVDDPACIEPLGSEAPEPAAEEALERATEEPAEEVPDIEQLRLL